MLGITLTIAVTCPSQFSIEHIFIPAATDNISLFLTSIFFLLLFKKIKIKSLFKIIVIVALIISPYVARNYFTFDQITIVKSLGYNLWKGNNQWSLTEGSEGVDTFLAGLFFASSKDF